jgi:hypothetical protein
MKKVTVNLFILFISFATFSCITKSYSPQSCIIPKTNLEVLTFRGWKVDKVNNLVDGQKKLIFDRGSSLISAKNNYNNVRIRFSSNGSMFLVNPNNEFENGNWRFANNETQIESKKSDQKDYISVTVDKLEITRLIFTQKENNLTQQYEFIPE